jgi:hypothetical protein
VDGEPVSGCLRKYRNREQNDYYHFTGSFVEWTEDGIGVAEDNKSPPNSFTGLFRQGIWVEGTFTTHDGFCYIGKFDAQGVKYHDPAGLLRFPPGLEFAEFTGTFENGRYISGTMQFASWSPKATYVGRFADGMLHGWGELTFKPGHPMGYKVFEGEFKENKLAHGTLTFVDGTTLEGSFKDDRPEDLTCVIRFCPVLSIVIFIMIHSIMIISINIIIYCKN